MSFSTWPTVAAAVTAGGLLLSAAAWSATPDPARPVCARKAAPPRAPTATRRPARPVDRAAAAASAAATRPALGHPPASDGNRFDYDSCGCMGA